MMNNSLSVLVLRFCATVSKLFQMVLCFKILAFESKFILHWLMKVIISMGISCMHSFYFRRLNGFIRLKGPNLLLVNWNWVHQCVLLLFCIIYFRSCNASLFNLSSGLWWPCCEIDIHNGTLPPVTIRFHYAHWLGSENANMHYLF